MKTVSALREAARKGHDAAASSRELAGAMLASALAGAAQPAGTGEDGIAPDMFGTGRIGGSIAAAGGGGGTHGRLQGGRGYGLEAQGRSGSGQEAKDRNGSGLEPQGGKRRGQAVQGRSGSGSGQKVQGDGYGYGHSDSDECHAAGDVASGYLAHVRDLRRDWLLQGRPDQKPPPGDWRTWLVMGGRGSGKTRTGAEWVHRLASAADRSDLRIALVAETLGDAREVMIDGISGICRIARRRRPDLEISRRRLVWPNGAMAQFFSSEDPESLRGPQFHFAWCDELAKWKYAQETWDMLQFALRLGADPRQLVTTTPRPLPLLKTIIADPATRLTRLATRSNLANLAPGFLDALNSRYGGTRLGRQELDGELIEDREDALWKRADIEAATVRLAGPLRRIVVAVDPPSGIGAGSCCGIVVAGLEASGRAVVLADCSVEGASPSGWAAAVVRAYRRFAADRIVAEVNQGGEMVSAVLCGIDAGLPVSTVRATRGKFLRAEPVAALYEQGRVVHAGRFSQLEDQMCESGIATKRQARAKVYGLQG